MKTEELIEMWNNTHKEVTSMHMTNKVLENGMPVKPARGFLWMLKFEAVIELAANSLFSVFLVHFIRLHTAEIYYVIAASILLFAMLLGATMSVIKLIKTFRVHYDMPVIEVQKELESLINYSRLEKKMLMINVPLMSVSVILVLAEALLGLNLLELVGQWLWLLGIISALIGILVSWLLLRYPDHYTKKTIQFLKAIETFQQEN